MTEFVRPGPLGTTEHDTVSEFSKIRLNRPSHSFIGKGQAPVQRVQCFTDGGTYKTDAFGLVARRP